MTPGAWAFRTPNRSTEDWISRKLLSRPIEPFCAVMVMFTPMTSGQLDAGEQLPNCPSPEAVGGFGEPTGASKIEPNAVRVTSSSVDSIVPARRLSNFSNRFTKPFVSVLTLPSWWTSM